MTKEIREVLNDLWLFVCGKDQVSLYSNTQNTTKKQNDFSVSYNSEKQTSRFFVPSNKIHHSLGQDAYVQFDDVTCFSEPMVAFDTKVKSLSYGDKVSVLRVEDSFAQIQLDDLNCWVSKYAITEDLKIVLPELRHGYVYDAQNDQTIKLRQLLKDETLGNFLELPLQSMEYILYLLNRSGYNIVWPNLRPRNPGQWKNILRGVTGVKMSIEPKTNSVMEYSGDDGKREFFGFVESVHPDLSFTLQSVGRVKEGEYRVEEFTKEQWKEWRPVFISFS